MLISLQRPSARVQESCPLPSTQPAYACAYTLTHNLFIVTIDYRDNCLGGIKLKALVFLIEKKSIIYICMYLCKYVYVFVFYCCIINIDQFPK